MDTIESNGRQTSLDMAEASHDGLATRIFLQPIAAPSIRGVFGFAGATFIAASSWRPSISTRQPDRWGRR